MSPAPLHTYHGNCHCGAFKFTAKLPELKDGMTCNCSICSKKGYIWAFPGKDDLVIERGLEDMITYKFGKESMAHKFCPTCGTAVCAVVLSGPREGSIGINARTLEGVDFWSINKQEYDGAALGGAYERPKFKGDIDDKSEDGVKTYTGSCHCGAVTYALKSKPLSEVQGLKECNCSICSRNANKFAYPNKNMVTIEGGENLTGYQFGTKFTEHQFCKTCGVPMFIHIIGPSKEAFDAMSAEKQELVKKKTELICVNINQLYDVEGNLEVEKAEGAKLPPYYTVPQ